MWRRVVLLALALAALPWTATAEEPQPAATVAALQRAAAGNDVQAFLALVDGNGVRWMGKRLGRAEVARRVAEQGVAGFLGLPPDGDWSVEGAGELAVGADGGAHVAVLNRRKGRWRLTEVRAAALPTPAIPDSLALAIVFDRSRAMLGAELELARRGALAALGQLADHDQVVVFDCGAPPYPIVRLDGGRNRRHVAAELARVQQGGSSSYPLQALTDAAEVLATAKATRKHILVLTGGDFADTLPEYQWDFATKGITVTVIGFDADYQADLTGLARSVGGGRVILADYRSIADEAASDVARARE